MKHVTTTNRLRWLFYLGCFASAGYVACKNTQKSIETEQDWSGNTCNNSSGCAYQTGNVRSDSGTHNYTIPSTVTAVGSGCTTGNNMLASNYAGKTFALKYPSNYSTDIGAIVDGYCRSGASGNATNDATMETNVYAGQTGGGCGYVWNIVAQSGSQFATKVGGVGFHGDGKNNQGDGVGGSCSDGEEAVNYKWIANADMPCSTNADCSGAYKYCDTSVSPNLCVAMEGQLRLKSGSLSFTMDTISPPTPSTAVTIPVGSGCTAPDPSGMPAEMVANLCDSASNCCLSWLLSNTADDGMMCRPSGEACSANAQCCSGTCSGGSCT